MEYPLAGIALYKDGDPVEYRSIPYRTILPILFSLLFLLQPGAQARTMSLDSVLEQAIRNSFDLKLAEIDGKVAKADSKIARADFFPTINAGYNTQYSRALSNQLNQQQVAAVGNTVLPGATGFQHVYSIGANYTLFDGGARLNTYIAARKRMQATTASKLVLVRDLSLTLTQLYTDALIDNESLKALQQTYLLHKRLFAVKQQLQESRTISKVELAEEALQLADVDARIQRIRESLGEKLHDMSLYTQEEYNVDDLQMEELTDDRPSRTAVKFNESKLPDVQRFNSEISSLKSELQAISAQRLPQVSFYSNLIFYGSSKNSWEHALAATGPRQIYMGLSLNFPLFDGFKNPALREKKKAQIERLAVERDKKVWELKAQHDKFTTGARQYSVELQTSVDMLNTGISKVSMLKKLNDHQLVDLGTLINEQIAVIDHRLSLTKAKTLRLSLLKKAAIIQS